MTSVKSLTRPSRKASRIAITRMKEADSSDEDEYNLIENAEKKTVDEEDEAEEGKRIMELKNKLTKVKITGIKLDQLKMLKRKFMNCDQSEWININKEKGNPPNNVYVDIKTGLYEILKAEFFNIIKIF